jgi:hypothetical protein
VALVRTDVSEEPGASFIRVYTILNENTKKDTSTFANVLHEYAD